jgi:enamine deaminase RidA (YjgF/YER057c/UK114 family)
MKERRHVPTEAPWAAVVGYSRAVRAGDHVWVSGTVAVAPEGGIAHPGDPYLQARRCIEIIASALKQAGAELSDVVRTRMFVRQPAHWEAVGRAHGEAFGSVLPATTMVFTGFIDPDVLVEIEAEAIVGTVARALPGDAPGKEQGTDPVP